MAEESTSWPMVSRPTYVGGLGFGAKWDMGWMHDTLQYLQRDPIHRKWHHGEITFRSVYSASEHFVLPLSHDEVVHGKGSLLNKMPGDDWQQFANLRLLYAYMYAQPGKKLLFMGAELAQRAEWNHDGSLDWELEEVEAHAGVERALADLNRLYRDEPALHALDWDPAGFEWIDANDADNSTMSFLRKDRTGDELILCIFNFTPVPRSMYRVGVPRGGFWSEVFNSDASGYWGSGEGNLGGVEALPVPHHGRHHSLTITLPPLGAVFLKSTASSSSAPASTASSSSAPASTASSSSASASTASSRPAPASTASSRPAPASTASSRPAPASTASSRPASASLASPGSAGSEGTG
jgi:1,4-alpha-glucan branching enzyme